MSCNDEDESLLLKPLVSTEIDLKSLTESKIDGNGVFDKLLTTANVHLENLYEKGYITKKELSDTYIGLYQATLQQATVFTLEKEKLPYDIESQQAQTRLAQAQVQLAIANKRLIQAQIIDAEADTDIKKLNQDKIRQDIELGNDQQELSRISINKAQKDLEIQNYAIDGAKLALIQTQSQIDLAQTQITVAKYEIEHKLPKEAELIDAQVLKMQSDAELSKEQVELAKAQLLQSEQDLKIKIAQLAIQQQQLELAKSQLKFQEQKVITEIAQTDGSVIKENSAMYYANMLMKAQTEAYEHDHLVKATKLFYDVVTAGIANDERTANTTNKLDDGNVGTVSDKLLQSVISVKV